MGGDPESGLGGDHQTSSQSLGRSIFRGRHYITIVRVDAETVLMLSLKLVYGKTSSEIRRFP